MAVLFAFCISPALAQTDTARITIDAPWVDYSSPKEYIIRDIEVTGIKYLDPTSVLITAGIIKGDTITIPGDYLSSALRTLMNRRQFADVQIFSKPDGQYVDLEVLLQERPRVYTWKYNGVTKGEEKELRESLKLRKGAELTDFIINSSRDAIKKYLREKGFMNVEVYIIQEDDSSINPNAVAITFDVEKGSKSKVGEIVFEGNETFTDRRLRRAFKKIHPAGINFFRNSKLKEKEYAEDKENLVSFYQANGYRNAAIVTDSVYQISPTRIGIKVTVDEGNQFHIRDIRWTGNSVYETSMLSSILGISSGDRYDRQAIEKNLGVGKDSDMESMSVYSMYQNNGYLFSQVAPVETVVGEDSIDLDIRILEGDQARVNEVVIEGNYRIDDQVIRRELYVRPGDLYDRSMLMQTMYQLNNTGHFYPESTVPQLNPVSSDLVDINFSLEEQASDQVQLSGGWGAGMFIASVGLQLNNFALKRFFQKDSWRPYPSGQGQQLNLRVQSSGSYYNSISLSFTEPWLGGNKPNALSVGMFYSSQDDSYWLSSSNRNSRSFFRTLGLSVGLGRRLSWPDRYFSIYNELSYQAYFLQDWSNFVVTDGVSNIFQVTTSFSRNSVDQMIYPRSGSNFSLSVSLTPPYSLFDNKDYSSPNISSDDKYRFIEFHKWKLHSQWYTTLDNANKFVLTARLEMGYIGSYNRNKKSPFEGFQVGGDGMSGYNVYGVDIIGLRGYENGALTQPYLEDGTVNYSTAYNKYILELRYPIIMQSSSTIYGLAFAEAGNAFNSWREFDPFQLKRSVGVGLRLFLPMIGTVGFDVGYGFDRAVGESEKSGIQTHFTMGTQF